MERNHAIFFAVAVAAGCCGCIRASALLLGTRQGALGQWAGAVLQGLLSFAPSLDQLMSVFGANVVRRTANISFAVTFVPVIKSSIRQISHKNTPSSLQNVTFNMHNSVPFTPTYKPYFTENKYESISILHKDIF